MTGHSDTDIQGPEMRRLLERATFTLAAVKSISGKVAEAELAQVT